MLSFNFVYVDTVVNCFILQCSTHHSLLIKRLTSQVQNIIFNYVLQLFYMPQEAPLDFFTAGKLAASLINSL